VQPGVEFSDTQIHPYQHQLAQPLSQLIKKYPNLVFEAHSTDYQTRFHLRQMVEDHFAILKVGPALTFKLRETLFDLAAIEEELLSFGIQTASKLLPVLNTAMLADPTHWEHHYNSNEPQSSFQRKFSFLDRSRYYWNYPLVKTAVEQLIRNLTDQTIPNTLISQFLPDLYARIREGSIKKTAGELIKLRISDVLNDYVYACDIS
jgi:D-tagatose-1,6-bisphosphate aldolase subunit GatZ/KbaZ